MSKNEQAGLGDREVLAFEDELDSLQREIQDRQDRIKDLVKPKAGDVYLDRVYGQIVLLLTNKQIFCLGAMDASCSVSGQKTWDDIICDSKYTKILTRRDLIRLLHPGYSD